LDGFSSLCRYWSRMLPMGPQKSVTYIMRRCDNVGAYLRDGFVNPKKFFEDDNSRAVTVTEETLSRLRPPCRQRK
jgi:hypothetical protein